MDRLKEHNDFFWFLHWMYIGYPKFETNLVNAIEEKIKYCMIKGKVIFAIYLPPISLEVSSKAKQIPLKTVFIQTPKILDIPKCPIKLAP